MSCDVLFRMHRPQIAHFHNTFPLISAAAYYAAHAENVRVVQTLHNFRLFCVNALLFRDGEVCEDCLGKAIPWRGIVHKCYRGSRAASSAVATMVTVHRMLGTWRNAVDTYIALSEVQPTQVYRGRASRGQDRRQIQLRLSGAGHGRGSRRIRRLRRPAVGRKGDRDTSEGVAEPWQGTAVEDRRRRSAGACGASGGGGTKCRDPMAARRFARDRLRPNRRGGISSPAVTMLRDVCSSCDRSLRQGHARHRLEAGSHGRTRRRRATGLHFEPGDPEDLAGKVRSILVDPLKLKRMRHAARRTFDRKFTADANHEVLMAIYERALSARSGHEMRG